MLLTRQRRQLRDLDLAGWCDVMAIISILCRTLWETAPWISNRGSCERSEQREEYGKLGPLAFYGGQASGLLIRWRLRVDCGVGGIACATGKDAAGASSGSDTGCYGVDAASRRI